MRRLGSFLRVAPLLGVVACTKPDSVELGGRCSQTAECTQPADTCMTLGSESLCSMACSADSPCPDAYVCARMNVRIEGEDGGDRADAAGYCLTRARVGPDAATIAPRDRGAAKRRGKKARGRGKRRKTTATDG